MLYRFKEPILKVGSARKSNSLVLSPFPLGKLLLRQFIPPGRTFSTRCPKHINNNLSVSLLKLRESDNQGMKVQALKELLKVMEDLQQVPQVHVSKSNFLYSAVPYFSKNISIPMSGSSKLLTSIVSLTTLALQD